MIIHERHLAVPNPLLHLSQLGSDVVAGDHSSPSSHGDVPGEYLEGGGLPCSIHSQQTKALTTRYDQIDAVHSQLGRLVL